MPRDDRLKQYQTAGADFLEAARSRAEEFLKELARASRDTSKQAQEQVDELVEAGRRGTDQILDTIRKEIATQLGQLGLATKDDLDALERRLSGRATASATKAPAGQTSPTRTSPSPAAPAQTAAAEKAPAKKAPPKRVAPKKEAGKKQAAKKAAAKKTAGSSGAAKAASPAR